MTAEYLPYNGEDCLIISELSKTASKDPVRVHWHKAAMVVSLPFRPRGRARVEMDV
jgi:hypothetical protein